MGFREAFCETRRAGVEFGGGSGLAGPDLEKAREHQEDGIVLGYPAELRAEGIDLIGSGEAGGLFACGQQVFATRLAGR